MQNIVTLGEINDALKFTTVKAAQLADMGFAPLDNKPICEALPTDQSRRLRNANIYPADSIGQIRIALAQRFTAPAPVQAAQFDVGISGNKTPQAVPAAVAVTDEREAFERISLTLTTLSTATERGYAFWSNPMKETGLMFKAPLVRAILSGKKIQTRRMVSPQPACVKDRKPFTLAGLPTTPINCPVGKPGDRIYVRETFVQGYEEDRDTGVLLTCDEEGNEIPKTTWYRATNRDLTWSNDGESEVNVPWKPAIHMPKALARLWLEVTGVRVERLQSISRGDAMAEGCPFPNMADGADPRQWFAEVWDSTTGRPSLPENENSKRYTRVKHWLETHPDTTG